MQLCIWIDGHVSAYANVGVCIARSLHRGVCVFTGPRELAPRRRAGQHRGERRRSRPRPRRARGLPGFRCAGAATGRLRGPRGGRPRRRGRHGHGVPRTSLEDLGVSGGALGRLVGQRDGGGVCEAHLLGGAGARHRRGNIELERGRHAPSDGRFAKVHRGHRLLGKRRWDDPSQATVSMCEEKHGRHMHWTHWTEKLRSAWSRPSSPESSENKRHRWPRCHQGGM